MCGLALSAGCSKNPKKSEPEPKWVILNEGREIAIKKMCFADSLNGWALNEMGIYTNAYWRTRDGGQTWELQGVPSSLHGGEHLNLTFIDTLYGWIVDVEGVIYRTKDGGVSWTYDESLYERPSYPKIWTVFFHDSLHGWIGYDGFGTRKIARTTDGGDNWEIVSTGSSRLRQALNKDVAFAEISWAANISRTTDGGATWQQIFPGIQNQPAGALVSFISEAEGWATIGWGYEENFGSLLIHTQDGGSSWDTLLNWPGRSLFDICMLPSRDGWILGSRSGGLLHTTDGVNWTDDPLPDIGDRPLHSLFVLPGPHAWVVAGGVLGGLVLKRTGD